jgi:hypothetical protein
MAAIASEVIVAALQNSPGIARSPSEIAQGPDH